MLADAVRPFGGKIVWRCFVYNCRQDWRDVQTDRPKAAWEHYAFLDGEFADNVILQVKHGPFDFQVREPLSPLLLGMKQTNLAMELQLAQEYTGHQIDLYTMISKEVTNISGGRLELKEATLYTAFRRLENAGCIRSYWGDETVGARRRYYSITEEGKRRLAEEADAWRETREVLNRLLEEE